MEIEKKDIRKITEKDINKLEKVIEMPLTEELKIFLMENNGAAISINNKRCIVSVKMDEDFTDSYPIESIKTTEEIIEAFEFIGFLNDFKEDFGLTDDFVETEKLIPIFTIPVGSLYYANGGKHTGKIYIADNGDFGIALIANTLNDFFNSLRPADN